jgi:hypothetical protein
MSGATMHREPRERARRTVVRLAAVLATLASLGCSVGPDGMLGPDNHVNIVNQAGHLEYSADNLQNVTTTITITWQNPAPIAAIQHLSFTPHGTNQLVITDADGKTVYDEKLLYELDDQTLAGTPGAWTVQFRLGNSVGQIDVILDASYPPD